MSNLTMPARAAERAPGASSLSRRILLAGRAIPLAGVVLPLFLIGILKFTAVEVEALKPLIGSTPWLAWLYAVLGFAGTSYLLGVVELVTAALFVASVRFPRAGVAAGALGTVTFVTTLSTMLTVGIWEASRVPFLNPTGAFLLKDVALLGVSLVVLGESLARTDAGTTRPTSRAG